MVPGAEDCEGDPVLYLAALALRLRLRLRGPSGLLGLCRAVLAVASRQPGRGQDQSRTHDELAYVFPLLQSSGMRKPPLRGGGY